MPLSDVQLLAPVPARNLLAVGLNYASHAGMAAAAAPEMIPKLPNALAGPNDPIWMFPDASNLHYEAELGLEWHPTISKRTLIRYTLPSNLSIYGIF